VLSCIDIFEELAVWQGQMIGAGRAFARQMNDRRVVPMRAIWGARPVRH
jgi:hypothetical protein